MIINIINIFLKNYSIIGRVKGLLFRFIIVVTTVRIITILIIRIIIIIRNFSLNN